LDEQKSGGGRDLNSLQCGDITRKTLFFLSSDDLSALLGELLHALFGVNLVQGLMIVRGRFKLSFKTRDDIRSHYTKIPRIRIYSARIVKDFTVNLQRTSRKWNINVYGS